MHHVCRFMLGIALFSESHRRPPSWQTLRTANPPFRTIQFEAGDLPKGKEVFKVSRASGQGYPSRCAMHLGRLRPIAVIRLVEGSLVQGPPGIEDHDSAQNQEEQEVDNAGEE